MWKAQSFFSFNVTITIIAGFLVSMHGMVHTELLVSCNYNYTDHDLRIRFVSSSHQ